MLRKILFPLILGLAGFAVLIALGVWQVQRLHWKTGILDQIDARISAAPVALPVTPDSAADAYLPVTVTGQIASAPLAVLVSTETHGAGYRMITAFDTADGRRILTDLGFLPVDARATPLPAGDITVTGNLLWPQETDSWTPAPDPSGIWFSRDAPAMAQALDAEPLLLVARAITPGSPTLPMPVGTEHIPNDHLGYAITWFLLAGFWVAMTALLIFRTLRPKDA